MKLLRFPALTDTSKHGIRVISANSSNDPLSIRTFKNATPFLQYLMYIANLKFERLVEGRSAFAKFVERRKLGAQVDVFALLKSRPLRNEGGSCDNEYR